jgi:hypothetical protein
LSAKANQEGFSPPIVHENSPVDKVALTRIRPFVAGAAGLLIFPLAYWVRTWQSFATVRDICPILFCDFADYYYPMGEAIFRTGLPVDGYLYSPFVAILLAAFPPLGLDASLVLWGVLQVLFVCFYFLLFRQVVPAAPPFQLLFIALSCSTYPLLINLMGGQVSVFIIVPLLGMLALDQRGRRAAAASLLALAVSFKFYPVIFLALFAARRDVRTFFLGAAACGTALFIVPGFVLGAGDTLGFYGALLDAFRDSGWVVTNPHSQFFPHVVDRLTGATAPHPVLGWIAYAVAAASLGLVFLVQRAHLRHADLWSVQLLFLTIPFILKTSWPHDFVFLPFTQAVLAWRLNAGVPGEPPARARTATIFSLLLVSIIFSNIVFFNLFGFSPYGFLGFLFWANLLLLIALYLLLLPPALQRLRVKPLSLPKSPSGFSD